MILTPRPGGRLPIVELDKPVSVQRIGERDNGRAPRARPPLRPRARRRPHLAGRRRRLLAGPPEGRRPAGRGRHAGPDAAQGRHGARPVLRGRPVRGRARRAGRRARAPCSASSPASGRSRTPGTTSRTWSGSASSRARSSRCCRAPASPRSTWSSSTRPARAPAARRSRTSPPSAPRRIAYVACDPAALARDLAWFAEEGYRPVTLRAFDLFPFTHHVECVAILVPASKVS